MTSTPLRASVFVIAAVGCLLLAASSNVSTAISNSCGNYTLEECSGHAHCIVPSGNEFCPFSCRERTCEEFLTADECLNNTSCQFYDSSCHPLKYRDCNTYQSPSECAAHSECIFTVEAGPYGGACQNKMALCNDQPDTFACDSLHETADCYWIPLEGCSRNISAIDTCEQAGGEEGCSRMGSACTFDTANAVCRSTSDGLFAADNCLDLSDNCEAFAGCMTGNPAEGSWKDNGNPSQPCHDVAPCLSDNSNSVPTERTKGLVIDFDWFQATNYSTKVGSFPDWEHEDTFYYASVTGPNKVLTVNEQIAHAYVYVALNNTDLQQPLFDARRFHIEFDFEYWRPEPGTSTRLIHMFVGNHILSIYADYHDNVIVHAFDSGTNRDYIQASSHPCLRLSGTGVDGTDTRPNLLVVNFDPEHKLITINNQYFGGHCMGLFLPNLVETADIVFEHGNDPTGNDATLRFNSFHFANDISAPHPYPTQTDAFCKDPFVLPEEQVYPEPTMSTPASVPGSTPAGFTPPPTFAFTTTSTTPCPSASASSDTTTNFVIPGVALAVGLLVGVLATVLVVKRRKRSSVAHEPATP